MTGCELMKAIALEISGKTACFRKPDVNVNVYFTYNHIHKVALLGLLGAVLGLGGYTAQNRDINQHGDISENVYPEFYAKLKHLRISIVPHGDRGYFSKKIQTFNNSVGYASQEQGNNLVVKEQWIENPHWTVYILEDGSEIYTSLKEALLTGRCVYIPYLGKNDHPAVLSNPREEVLQKVSESNCINSLFTLEAIEFQKHFHGEPYFYKEYLPVGLDELTNGYVFNNMAFTNRKIKNCGESLYLCKDKYLYFF